MTHTEVKRAKAGISTRLREARKGRGLNQEKLAN